ncbi:MAG: hypothetical protein QNJ98_19980 [Planctomycetota bacterium]|nr:hypothetical protein [Planctomycetota bacterium]
MDRKAALRSVFRTPISPIITIALLVTLFMSAADGGSVSGLTTFTNGTTANADEVNANFQTIAAAVNDNDTRITALEGTGLPGQIISSRGLTPPQGGSVFGIYAQAGSLNTAEILIPRAGTLELFSARPAAMLAANATVEVRMLVNGIQQGLLLNFADSDGTTTKSDMTNVINVNAGDLLTFSFTETGNTAAPGTSLHASVIFK